MKYLMFSLFTVDIKKSLLCYQWAAMDEPIVIGKIRKCKLELCASRTFLVVLVGPLLTPTPQRLFLFKSIKASLGLFFFILFSRFWNGRVPWKNPSKESNPGPLDQEPTRPHHRGPLWQILIQGFWVKSHGSHSEIRRGHCFGISENERVVLWILIRNKLNRIVSRLPNKLFFSWVTTGTVAWK